MWKVPGEEEAGGTDKPGGLTGKEAGGCGARLGDECDGDE